MIDKINDQLSAMLDDELDERECELLLSRVSRDPQLRGVWQRYALIGDCIRGSVPEFVAPAMAGRIAAAVASNGTPVAVLKPARGARWRPLAGAAIAASVAALAIVTLGDLGSPASQPNTVPVASLAEDSYIVPVVSRNEQVSAAMRERLNLYQVSHSEFAGPLQRRAILTQISGDDETLSSEEGSREDSGTRK